jgi:hypothetical protein
MRDDFLMSYYGQLFFLAIDLEERRRRRKRKNKKR